METEKFCVRCGYCLHGLTSERCAECGLPFRHGDPRSYTMFPRAIAVRNRACVAAALLVVIVFAYASWRYVSNTLRFLDRTEICVECGSFRSRFLVTLGTHPLLTRTDTERDSALATILQAERGAFCRHSWYTACEDSRLAFEPTAVSRQAHVARCWATEVRVDFCAISDPSFPIPNIRAEMREMLRESHTTRPHRIGLLMMACRDRSSWDAVARLWGP